MFQTQCIKFMSFFKVFQTLHTIRQMLGVILSEWGLGVFVQGIQITATTPTSSAVRLETGSVDLEVSNRVLMATDESKQKGQDTGCIIEHYFSIVYCELRPMITFHYINFTVLMNIVYFLYHRILQVCIGYFFLCSPKSERENVHKSPCEFEFGSRSTHQGQRLF